MPSRSLLPTLSALSDDLRGLRAKEIPWGAVVRADRTLPTGDEVEAWYLAAFFLRLWANGIARAVQRIPNNDAVLLARESTTYAPRNELQADALADELTRDTTLDPYLADHVGLLASTLSGQSSPSRNAGGLVRATVDAHEWCVLLAVIVERQRKSQRSANQRTLPRFRIALAALTRSVRECSFSLLEAQRAYAAELMRDYRNSTRSFSWMPYCQGDAESEVDDPLFPDKKEIAVIRDLAERVARECEGVEGVPVAVVRSLVERIAGAVLQKGYQKFADDTASSGLFSDEELTGNRPAINVIPGDEPGQCAPVLVAVARAGRKTSLPKILPRIRKHLIDCDPITKVAVVVSDEWNPSILGDSLGDLKSHVAKGKRIVFLLAPQPGSGVVHIPVTLM